MAEKKQRRRMLVAFVILLVALAVILVSDRAIWFAANKASNGDNTSPGQIPVLNNTPQAAPAHNPASPPESVPNRMAHLPSVPKPASNAEAKNNVAAKSFTEPGSDRTADISAIRTELSPIEVEVVAGDTHRTVRPGSNSLKVEMQPHSGSPVGGLTAFEWSPVTNAAERTRLSVDQPDALSPPVKSSYPSLARQMKVEGSVLLQALVGSDGGIQSLRVLGGNPILVPAALEAARQWRFRPYLQNGQPVETQAKIVVDFKIKIL